MFNSLCTKFKDNTTTLNDIENITEEWKAKIEEVKPEQENKTYWKEDINEIIKAIKDKCLEYDILYDPTNERKAANRLKSKKWTTLAEKKWLTLIELLKKIISMSMKVSFRKWTINSCMKLHYKWFDVINEYNKAIESELEKKIPEIAKRWNEDRDLEEQEWFTNKYPPDIRSKASEYWKNHYRD